MRTLIRVGDKFCDLTVLKFSRVKELYKRKNSLWLCVCICGETREVTSRELNDGQIKRCKSCSQIKLKQNLANQGRKTRIIAELALKGKLK